MPKPSAGILAYRKHDNQLQVFLVHPGGPFYKKKDLGVWSIPKGEYEPDEEPLMAAKREFEEETGQTVSGDFAPLAPIKYKSGKVVHAWATEAEIDQTNIKSNFFEMEWPPKSGKIASFEEVDRGDWFDIETAKKKLVQAQVGLVEELERIV